MELISSQKYVIWFSKFESLASWCKSMMNCTHHVEWSTARCVGSGFRYTCRSIGSTKYAQFQAKQIWTYSHSFYWVSVPNKFNFSEAAWLQPWCPGVCCSHWQPRIRRYNFPAKFLVDSTWSPMCNPSVTPHRIMSPSSSYQPRKNNSIRLGSSLISALKRSLLLRVMLQPWCPGGVLLSLRGESDESAATPTTLSPFNSSVRFTQRNVRLANLQKQTIGGFFN